MVRPAESGPVSDSAGRGVRCREHDDPRVIAASVQRKLYYGWVVVGTLAATETISWGILYYAFAAFLKSLALCCSGMAASQATAKRCLMPNRTPSGSAVTAPRRRSIS